MKSHLLRSSLSSYYNYIGSNSSGNNATTYTYTSQSIGTADSSRLVVVIASGSGTNVISGVTCTIGGVSATRRVQILDGVSQTDVTALFTLAVPAGTTADIVLTFSAQVNRSGIAVYSLYNLKDPERANTFVFNPTGSGTDRGDEASSSITLNQRYGGIVLYGSRVFNNLTPPALPTFTFSTTSLGDTVTYNQIFRLGAEVNVMAVGSFKAKYTGSNTVTLNHDGGNARVHTTVAAAFY